MGLAWHFETFVCFASRERTWAHVLAASGKDLCREQSTRSEPGRGMLPAEGPSAHGSAGGSAPSPTPRVGRRRIGGDFSSRQTSQLKVTSRRCEKPR